MDVPSGGRVIEVEADLLLDPVTGNERRALPELSVIIPQLLQTASVCVVRASEVQIRSLRKLVPQLECLAGILDEPSEVRQNGSNAGSRRVVSVVHSLASLAAFENHDRCQRTVFWYIPTDCPEEANIAGDAEALASGKAVTDFRLAAWHELPAWLEFLDRVEDGGHVPRTKMRDIPLPFNVILKYLPYSKPTMLHRNRSLVALDAFVFVPLSEQYDLAAQIDSLSVVPSQLFCRVSHLLALPRGQHHKFLVDLYRLSSKLRSPPSSLLNGTEEWQNERIARYSCPSVITSPASAGNTGIRPTLMSVPLHVQALFMDRVAFYSLLDYVCSQLRGRLKECSIVNTPWKTVNISKASPRSTNQEKENKPSPPDMNFSVKCRHNHEFQGDENSALEFPVFCKHTLGAGFVTSHHVCIAYSPEGVRNFGQLKKKFVEYSVNTDARAEGGDLPLWLDRELSSDEIMLQEIVPHDPPVVHKIFILASFVWVATVNSVLDPMAINTSARVRDFYRQLMVSARKQLLPEIPANFDSVLEKEHFTDFLSTQLKATSHAISPLVSLDNSELPTEDILILVDQLSSVLGTRAFGIDIIKDKENPHQLYIVDLNFFPGYANMSNLAKPLEEYFRDLAALDVSR